MKKNPWFRMYSETATDPKIQMMSEQYQRRWFMLLCVRCGNDDVTFHDEELSFQLRISLDDWLETKSHFVRKKLIDAQNNIVAWDKRQYVSDSSTARVQKHRESKKQSCNVSATPPDTDTDTDINNAQKAHLANFTKFWQAYPKKKDKQKAQKSFLKIKPSESLLNEIIQDVQSRPDWKDIQFIPLAATYLNNARWEDEHGTKKKPQGVIL